MKKITLLSVLASTLIFAGGDISPVVEPVVPTPTFEDEVVDTGSAGIPMGIALLGGIMQGDGDDAEWNPVYGAEFSFKCLLSDSVRSQIQFTNYDQDNLKMMQLSLNPHYIFNRGNTVEFGVGPHVGLASVEIGSEDDIVYTYGGGASITANLTEHFFLGAEARYEWTTETTFAGTDTNFNNAKIFGKIGYSF